MVMEVIVEVEMADVEDHHQDEDIHHPDDHVREAVTVSVTGRVDPCPAIVSAGILAVVHVLLATANTAIKSSLLSLI